MIYRNRPCTDRIYIDLPGMMHLPWMTNTIYIPRDLVYLSIYVIRLSLGKLLVYLCQWSNGLIPY